MSIWNQILFLDPGDADSSRAPGLTSGLQGSVNVHRGALYNSATVTVHQFCCIFHIYLSVLIG